MSLKAFHLFFVIVALIFCVWLGFWGVRDYFATRNTTNLIIGLVGFFGGGGLGIYLPFILKKLKAESYL